MADGFAESRRVLIRGSVDIKEDEQDYFEKAPGFRPGANLVFALFRYRGDKYG